LEGQVVYVLPFDYLTAGRQSAQGDKYAIDVSGFANGVYLLQLRSDEAVVNKKIIISH